MVGVLEGVEKKWSRVKADEQHGNGTRSFHGCRPDRQPGWAFGKLMRAPPAPLLSIDFVDGKDLRRLPAGCAELNELSLLRIWSVSLLQLKFCWNVKFNDLRHDNTSSLLRVRHSSSLPVFVRFNCVTEHLSGQSFPKQWQ